MLVSLVCLPCAAHAQDCAIIGAGYDKHGHYDTSDLDVRETQRLKEAIKKSDIQSAYFALWESADPQVLIRGWPRLGLRLFRSMLLQMAVANDNPRQVRKLLRQGAEVNLEAGDSLMTPLIVSLACASPDVTFMLLRAGANVNQGTYYGLGSYASVTNSTPIEWAASGTDLAVVQALLHAGANPNAQENYVDAASNKSRPDQTPLLGDPIPAIMITLLKAGANPNLGEADGETPLIAAASAGDTEGCYLLLNAGADKRHRQNDGETAEAAARKAGYAELANAIAGWTLQTPEASWPRLPR